MEFGEAIVWRVIVTVLLCLGATCRRYPEQEREYDRTGGCILPAWLRGFDVAVSAFRPELDAAFGFRCVD